MPVLTRALNLFRRKPAPPAPIAAPPRLQRVLHDADGIPYLNGPALAAERSKNEMMAEIQDYIRERIGAIAPRMIGEMIASAQPSPSKVETLATTKVSIATKQSDSPPSLNTPGGNRPSVTVRYVTPGAPTWMNRDYASYARNAYAMNSDVYSCISLIASAAKQIKIDDTGKGRASAELLKKAGGPTFIEYWISYLLISGNAYIEIGRNGSGQPVSVYLLSPDRVTAQTNINTPGASDTYRPEVRMWKVLDAKGIPRFLAPSEIIHSRLFNPLDPICGMSPIEAALLDIDAQNESAALMKRTMQSGFTPGWIEAGEESDWSDTQIAQLKERLRRSREGGEALFLQQAKWHEIGVKPVDAEIATQQTMSKRDIASVFHVDPALIGDVSTRTYATYQESRRALYMEAVNPLVKMFSHDWNAAIAEPPPGALARPGYNGSPLTADKDSFDAITAARAEATDRVHKLWTSGLITQNEARRDLEYDPVSGGDVFYAPANFLPLQGSEAEPL
jgi:HK97 family phage portal protein